MMGSRLFDDVAQADGVFTIVHALSGSGPLVDSAGCTRPLNIRWNNMHHCMTTLSEVSKLPEI